MFDSLESAITDYTSGALDGYERNDVEGWLKDRVEQGRQDLEVALERIRALVEPVEPPKETLEHQHYFVASTPGDAAQIKVNEGKRTELYKAVSGLVRAYTALANNMEAAGYSATEAAAIKNEVAHFVAVRAEVEEGAVRIVVETGKPIAQVARELGINPGTLANRVAFGAAPPLAGQWGQRG